MSLFIRFCMFYNVVFFVCLFFCVFCWFLDDFVSLLGLQYIGFWEVGLSLNMLF